MKFYNLRLFSPKNRQYLRRFFKRIFLAIKWLSSVDFWINCEWFDLASNFREFVQLTKVFFFDLSINWKWNFQIILDLLRITWNWCHLDCRKRNPLFFSLDGCSGFLKRNNFFSSNLITDLLTFLNPFLFLFSSLNYLELFEDLKYFRYPVEEFNVGNNELDTLDFQKE